ncbi:hypothetical protein LF95_03670 [Thalassospira sp. TSL5-1]|nr:hypothetical protein LF95_03670 [Thalassospira sp. TSL5-1]
MQRDFARHDGRPGRYGCAIVPAGATGFARTDAMRDRAIYVMVLLLPTKLPVNCVLTAIIRTHAQVMDGWPETMRAGMVDETVIKIIKFCIAKQSRVIDP